MKRAASGSLIVLSAVLCLWSFSRTNVHATGGAYISTKHGGATTDGVVPFGGGVNRGVNPDYGTGIYNTVNPEAGQYQAGECSHCHEAHASFGGTEPPPISGSTADVAPSPNAYLGMADTNPEFCWYCHENLTLNAKPIGHGYWDFYWGKNYYTPPPVQGGHYNNANMKSPGYGVSQPWPRTNRTSNLSSGHCLNCHTPHGIKETTGSEFDTTAVPTAPTNKHLSANNPDVSTNNLIPRQLIAWEEALCENCHKTGGVVGAADVRTDILKLDTVAAGGTGTGSGHPLHNVDQTGSNAGATFSGRHSLKNELTPAQGWNSYSGTVDRHVECVDCHNPHVAQNATVFQQSGAAANPNRVAGPAGIYAGGTNKGVWGIRPIDTATGSTAASAKVDDANSSIVNYSSLYLYEICLKCHSIFADTSLTSNATPSWSNRTRWETTTAPGYYFGTTQMNLSDVAVDFSMSTTPITGTLLKGYHPVFGQGRNQPASTANCRWSRTRLDVSCTPVTGGNENATRPTGVRDTTIGFANNFVPPWGPTSLVTCVDCHESNDEAAARGPHGSDRPFVLRKLNTAITYTVVDDGYAGNGTGVYTVNYSSFDQGWVSTSDNYGIAGVILGTWDPNNLCLNCHRADVYGFLDQCYTSGAAVTNDSRYPRYRYLSRQPHPADGGTMFGACNSFDSAGRQFGTGAPPRGIVCLRCHAGGTIGGIHGDSGATGYTYTTTNITPSSNRLLNGTAWTGVTFGSTSVTGSCTKNGGATLFNACTNGASGNFDTRATYNY